MENLSPFFNSQCKRPHVLWTDKLSAGGFYHGRRSGRIQICCRVGWKKVEKEVRVKREARGGEKREEDEGKGGRQGDDAKESGSGG